MNLLRFLLSQISQYIKQVKNSECDFCGSAKWWFFPHYVVKFFPKIFEFHNFHVHVEIDFMLRVIFLIVELELLLLLIGKKIFLLESPYLYGFFENSGSQSF